MGWSAASYGATERARILTEIRRVPDRRRMDGQLVTQHVAASVTASAGWFAHSQPGDYSQYLREAGWSCRKTEVGVKPAKFCVNARRVSLR